MYNIFFYCCRHVRLYTTWLSSIYSSVIMSTTISNTITITTIINTTITNITMTMTTTNDDHHQHYHVSTCRLVSFWSLNEPIIITDCASFHLEIVCFSFSPFFILITIHCVCVCVFVWYLSLPLHESHHSTNHPTDQPNTQSLGDVYWRTRAWRVRLVAVAHHHWAPPTNRRLRPMVFSVGIGRTVLKHTMDLVAVDHCSISRATRHNHQRQLQEP